MDHERRCISMYLLKKKENFPTSLSVLGVNTLHPIPASWHPNPQLTLVAASPESRKSAVPGATWEISKRPICAWQVYGRSKADVGEIS